MPAALSVDLRHRVVAALEQGLSCSQVAERFGVSPASASRWRARLSTHGSVAAAPMGGDRRSAGLEEHAPVMLDHVAQTPDLTLERLKYLFAHDWSRALQLLWHAGLGALLLWALAMVPLGLALNFGLRPLFRRLLARQNAA